MLVSFFPMHASDKFCSASLIPACSATEADAFVVLASLQIVCCNQDIFHWGDKNQCLLLGRSVMASCQYAGGKKDYLTWLGDSECSEELNKGRMTDIAESTYVIQDLFPPVLQKHTKSVRTWPRYFLCSSKNVSAIALSDDGVPAEVEMSSTLYTSPFTRLS